MQNHRLIQIIFLQQNNRFLVLLISLILFFCLYPIVENFPIASVVLNIFFMLIVFSGVLAISNTKKPLMTSLTLALLTVLFRWVDYFDTAKIWAMLENAVTIIFWFYIALHILKFILQHKKITAELIYAALAVYFILGLAWASIYHLIEISNPDSFSVSNHITSGQHFSFQMWYFSMVTLTTLGYGDIAPLNMSARVFVILEAILGQFYLAVLIANLVGRQIEQEKH